MEDNKYFPVIAIKANGDDFSLASIVGPEILFQRLGEFLACMTEQTGFYVTKIDDDKVDTNLVEMEPISDEEIDTEDMDKDTGVYDTVENKF